MKRLATVAWVLGYGGLIPFFLLTIALVAGGTWLPDALRAQLPQWLAAYAAVILSFLGAVHWGVALGMQERLTAAESQHLFIYSVVPGLLGWFALLLPLKTALLVLAGLIIAAYVADRRWLFTKLNSNYAQLRLHLSTVVSLLLGVASVAGVD